jgi:hypothetical protein
MVYMDLRMKNDYFPSIISGLAFVMQNGHAFCAVLIKLLNIIQITSDCKIVIKSLKDVDKR